MKNNPKTSTLSYWGNLIIGCGLFITVSILAYQLYLWLKNGEWLAIPLYKPFQYLGFNFVGILDMEWDSLQKSIFWLLEKPLAGVIGVSSLIIGWLMTLKN